MRLILLAALAAATPAMAQDTPAQSTPQTAAPATPDSTATTTTNSTAPDAATAAPPAAPDAATAAPPAPTAGGYQPDHPALSGALTPGVKPQFVQAPPPDQAFPAPAPLAHYPYCKRGQFDKCMQRHSPK